MRKIIYTTLFGDYEHPNDLTVKTSGFEHLFFTDNRDLKVPGWEMIYIRPKKDPKKQSREIKINIHKFIHAYVYIYVDANYIITKDLNAYVKQYFKGGYLTQMHPTRKCISEEAKRIIEIQKDKHEIVNKQISEYFKEGMPLNYGLFMNGFFIRDNSFNELCEDWYKEVDKYSYRDQLSLPYVLWKNKRSIKVVKKFASGRFLRLDPHRNEVPNIYHFVPGAGDKNLGREINKHCEIVPNDDDWIVIRDNDTCYLHPFINKQLEDIIKKHGNRFEIFSCVTNRLGLGYQLPYGLMNETNIIKLRDLADKHYSEFYDEVKPCTMREPTAGLFTMFQKKTWKKLKYQDGLANAGGFIDWRFTKGHLMKGRRIGICKGIFLFHYYRLHQDNVREYAHLK